MFSLVQNISSALKPLLTEGIDARLGNKAHDIEEIGEDRSESEENSDRDAHDYSVLSVKALILFLEGFLEARLGSKLNYERGLRQESLAPWFKAQQSNDDAYVQPKNAAKAYAHAAKTLYAPLKKNTNESGTSLPAQAELKNVYFLIRDLRHLQDCGVEHLKIESKRTFLDGIFSAVENLKSEHSQ